MKHWIGVDFDGTLVVHAFPKIGLPIWPMINRIKAWLEEGKYDVKILTARVGTGEVKYRTADEERKLIQDWCESVGLPRLEVTASKDFMMVQLWDDRAIQVIKNTGKIATEEAYDRGYADASDWEDDDY